MSTKCGESLEEEGKKKNKMKEKNEITQVAELVEK